MRIAIVGAGVTGLTAAYKLAKKGHQVTVFEKEQFAGGLAGGFRPACRQAGWNWFLEKTYHHLFANDTAAFTLVKELGLSDKLIIKRPITANYLNGQIYPFDSPVHLLQFPALPLVDRLRTGLLAAFCKVNPFWKPLENFTAEKFVQRLGGQASWKILWEPLLYGKFGNLAPTVSAAWFWARIHKRTPKLCYLEGGFQTLIDKLVSEIKRYKGVIKFNSPVANTDKLAFNKILFTITKPSPIKHLQAQTLILETKQPILKNVYWLNILDRSFPFLAVVAHTNFMEPKHYSGHHLTYFGNYLPDHHPYLKMTKQQLFKLFLPFIKRLNPGFNNALNYELFTGFNAQPVHQLHYSQIAPKLQTAMPNVYLANLDSIIPWDRGMNYSIELGKKAAENIG